MSWLALEQDRSLDLADESITGTSVHRAAMGKGSAGRSNSLMQQ
tara:strand:+ start:136 stop:267 length:132 start_codon:yes stop_codon:yes gene_type:complete